MRVSEADIAPFYARERILIVEVNWLGDVLFSTPAIRAIRKAHPGAYIAALVVPRCKDALMGNNYLDEVMVLEESGRHRGFLGKLRLIREIRVRHFNIVYFFHRSFSRTLCCFLAGIKRRVGYYTKKRGFLLTDKLISPVGEYHRADIYYYVVTGSKIPKEERYCDFFVTSEDEVYVDHWLKSQGLDSECKIVVLHVGGNWELKLWPEKYFAELIDRLVQDYDVEVVISGTHKDAPRAQKIASYADHKPKIACGVTNLKQLGALFQKSDLVISADSGPLHVALAVKAKAVALYGPTSIKATGPLTTADHCSVLSHKDIHCVIPCYNLSCQNNICMSTLTPDLVLSEVEKQGWLIRRK
ncbi:MAG: lipopolysaccharide heptosyltransferase II [Candidatus Omnitrophota bacterium]